MSQKVSVIMPAYNAESYIKDSIISVLNQTYKDLELIIIDDGSTDNTKSIIMGFSDERLRYLYQENQGQGKARNLGIKESAGDLIAFIDSDDIWKNDKLEKQVVCFEKNNDLGLVYSDCRYFGPSDLDGKLASEINKSFQGKILKHLLKKNFITNSSVMVRRSAIDSVGLFNESDIFRSVEDYDLWLRLAARHEAGFIPENLVKYRYVQKISDNRTRAKSYRRMAAIYFNLLPKEGFARYFGIIVFRGTAFYTASIFLRII